MEEYGTVATLENEIEARVLAAVLDEAGIPYALRSYHDVAFDGLFQMRKGWGTIDAPMDRHEEIREILEEMRAGPGDEEE